MKTMSVGGEEFNSDTEFWNQPYYRLTKNVASLFGLWPYQSTKQLVIHRTIAYFLFLIEIGPQLAGARHYYNNFNLMMDYAAHYLVDIVLVMNTSTCLMSFRRIRCLLDEIKENWIIVTEDYGRHKLEEHSELGRQIIAFCVGTVYPATLIVSTEPLQRKVFNYMLNKNETVPDFFMPLEYPSFIDIKKFHYPLILTNILSVMVNSSLTTLDIFFFLFCHHTFGMFSAIGYAIENMPVNYTKENDEGFERIKKCIKLHDRTLKFVQSLEELFVWNFGIILGLHMLLMSAAAVEVVVESNTFGDLIRNGLFVAIGAGHLFILCIMSQRLIDYSLKIQMHIECSHWFQSSLKTQKLLRLMMMRSQTPCQLSAGKLMFMSLPTFTMITKASVSYFTVFLTMR